MLRRLLLPVIVLGLAACGSDKSVAPPPTVAAIVVTPGADTLWTLGRTRQFIAQPRDANGNPVSGVTVVWQSSNPAVATVDNATGIVTAVGNGLSVISAHVSSIVGQANLAVSQVVAAVVVTPPSASFTAVGDTQRFVAVAKDSGNATVPGVRFLWGSSNGVAATVDTLGLATGRGAGAAILSATGRGIPGYATINVAPISTRIVITGQPSDLIAGDAFNPAIRAEIRDGRGNVVANYQGAVTVALIPSFLGKLHGSTTVSATGGVATFSGLWVDRAAAGYRLVVTGSGVPGSADTSAAFAVTAAAPAAIYFQQEPVSGQGNLPAPAFQVNVVDAFNNPTAATVSIALGLKPWSQASLSGNTVIDAVNGTAIFDSVVIDRPGSGYTIVAVASSVSWPLTVESHPFAISLQFTSVAMTLFTTCGATLGGAYCWGLGYDSIPAPMPGGQVFDALAGGDYHMCGHQADNTVWCWGENGSGQLGIGSPGGTFTTPQQVNNPFPFTQVVAGHYHTCALTDGYIAYCWGLNANGQLGDSTTTQRNAPVRVARSIKFSRLAAGGSHTCGLGVADSLAACWGANGSGQLGNGTTSDDSAPHAVVGAFVAHIIAATDLSTCADSADFGGVYCWGDDTYGEIGFGGDTTAPRLFGGTAVYQGITSSLGAFYCYNGGVDNVCRGNNASGQLGIGTTTGDNSSGAPVGQGIIVFDVLSAGSGHACGISYARGLYCWGANYVAQLGTGSTIKSYLPVRVVQ